MRVTEIRRGRLLLLEGLSQGPSVEKQTESSNGISGTVQPFLQQVIQAHHQPPCRNDLCGQVRRKVGHVIPVLCYLSKFQKCSNVIGIFRNSQFIQTV